MKFHKGQIVHRACLAEFEGAEHPIVILAKVAVVCPQRDGSTTYHLHNFDGLKRGEGAVWTTYNTAEDSLHENPLEAMHVAVSALRPGSKSKRERCAEGVTSV